LCFTFKHFNMKRLCLSLLIGLPFLLNAQPARIKIDIDRIIGEIDPKIYGVFMEPIHFNGSRLGLPDSVSFNTLYGNLYDPESSLADEHGFRKDYLEAMRELKITNMRWPGGNFVAAYNWQDGIGPKDQRPVRKNLAWGGFESNQVGTDEWVQLNRSIGSENVICINLGLGNIDDARYWVEYCNAAEGTYYADLRAQYGNPEPFDVKLWCLGNEVDGSPWIMGYKNAEDYCKIARETAKAMRATDNTIEFVANGSSYYESTGIWIDWNRKIINELGDIAKYLSIHKYWERSDDYYEYVGQSAFEVEEKINAARAQINVARTLSPDMKMKYLSVDEYAPFGHTMQTTMAVAMYLNSFIRHADFVKMANYTLATSLLAYDREKGTFRSPLFYTFKLYSTNCYGKSVDTWVKCDTFNTGRYKGIPYLDATTVYNTKSNSLFINVVNRHKDKSISAEIETLTGFFKGNARVKVITHDTLNEPFRYELQHEYKPVATEIKTENREMSFSFPAHSFTQIQVDLKD